MLVRPLASDDHAWKVETLERTWGSTLVARLDELVDAADLPGFVAHDVHDAGVAVVGDRVGLLVYAARPNGFEVVAIVALVEGRGIGTALMDAALTEATARGADRLWLITTNDNLRAIGFYQRWGMDLVRLVHDGVVRSRLLKPTIPATGHGGIPIRHELELELVLRPTPL